VRNIEGFDMIKYIILVITSLWTVYCVAHTDRYYRLHPNALQDVISQCSNKQSKGVDCDQLNAIASQVNALAYQLRLDAQGYGKDILALQESIAKQEMTLHDAPNQAEIQKSLIENRQKLEVRLAVVKWLESPGGA
jgi:hypothetical protein